MLNKDIAEVLKQDKRNVVADSAEPKSIKELQGYGVRVRGADKGRDSVMFGIQLMQQFEFLVTARSTDLIKEFRYYCWDSDKTGKRLNRPIDAHNHAIDAVRYFITNQNKNKISVGGV